MGSLNIGTGDYYGNGAYGSGTSSSGTYSSRTRAASSVNFTTMSRNIASGYSSDMEMIQKYMEQGKTDKAIEKYENLFDDIKATTSNYRYELTDGEIESILKSAYQMNTGTSLVNSIEENTSGSFWTGVKESIPIFGFFANGTSEDEALAKLSNDEVSIKDKALEATGALVGTIAGVAGGVVLCGACLPLGIGLIASSVLTSGIKFFSK